jgi:hypothetical protein
MAHYAKLNENNIVTEVFVGKNEGEDGVDWEKYYDAKRTSYNTYGGVHFSNGTPFRKNYAGIGYSYDLERDAFVPPKPYPSWTLDEATCLWKAPVSRPNDEKIYNWNESSLNWVEITIS